MCLDINTVFLNILFRKLWCNDPNGWYNHETFSKHGECEDAISSNPFKCVLLQP